MLNESLIDQHVKILWKSMASNTVGEAGNQKKNWNQIGNQFFEPKVFLVRLKIAWI